MKTLEEEIVITRGETDCDFGFGVTIQMPEETAKQIVADLSRLHQLLDDTVGCEEMSDAVAMDRVSDLIHRIKTELKIK